MENELEQKEIVTDEPQDETRTQPSEGSTTPSGGNTTSSTDNFDLEAYRMTQDYESLINVKRIITTVPVKKPERQWFVRVHPEWKLETAVLEDKDDRTTYLIVPSLWADLDQEITRKVLFPAITTHRVIFLWPIKLPGEDGRADHWNESSLEAAQLAKRNWIRVRANMQLGAYEVLTAGGTLPEPEWPQDTNFNELVKVAFKGRIITEWEHPVLKRLRGE
ncbi:MAG: hypothetical protein ACLQPD_19125 [Desulfomonilaceae bacterium]